MRDLQTLREKKKALGLTNALIADLSGVPLGTVQKVFSGVTKIRAAGARGARRRSLPA